MHDVAAGITAGRQKTKPRGLSVVRGGRGVAGRTVGTARRDLHLCRAPGPPDSTTRCMVSSSSPKADRERRLTDEEYRQLGKALSIAHQGECLEAGDRCHMADDHNRVATRRGAGPAMVGGRSATTNCTTGRHQDRRIDAAVVRSSLCCDQRPAEERRYGVRQSIRRDRSSAIGRCG